MLTFLLFHFFCFFLTVYIFVCLFVCRYFKLTFSISEKQALEDKAFVIAELTSLLNEFHTNINRLDTIRQKLKQLPKASQPNWNMSECMPSLRFRPRGRSFNYSVRSPHSSSAWNIPPKVQTSNFCHTETNS